MRFCEFAKFMHENYEANANDSEFVSILIDAILDESALEKEETRIRFMGSARIRDSLITAASARFHKGKPRRLFQICPRNLSTTL